MYIIPQCHFAFSSELVKVLCVSLLVPAILCICLPVLLFVTSITKILDDLRLFHLFCGVSVSLSLSPYS